MHHSDLKTSYRGKLGTWIENPHWRSAVARGEVKALGERVGLRLVSQTSLPWGGADDAILDCISIFVKP